MKNKSNKKIRNFASMVLKTGKEYNIKVLENYGMELEEYIDSFNVKNINALLSDFSEMAKIIS
jgi:formylmethanofuran dehydrogenase subunit A